MTARVGTALVTGAAGHLGSCIVRALAARTFTVAINDVDNTSAARLAGTVEGAATFAADVSDHEAASQLVEDVIDRCGPIDVLVNAAGVEGPVAAIEHLDPDEVRHVFDVNVMSMFWVCGAIVPAMKRNRKGRIVNIASGAGLAGGAFASPYHASKHAVVGLTRSLARELAPHEIAVNAVCPGYVDSPMVERITKAEEALTGQASEVLNAIPMGRMADPEEVAATVTFLALDAPIYMSGESLVIDGALRA